MKQHRQAESDPAEDRRAANDQGFDLSMTCKTHGVNRDAAPLPEAYCVCEIGLRDAVHLLNKNNAFDSMVLQEQSGRKISWERDRSIIKRRWNRPRAAEAPIGVEQKRRWRIRRKSAFFELIAPAHQRSEDRHHINQVMNTRRPRHRVEKRDRPVATAR